MSGAAATWPIRCPVDRQWIRTETGPCSGCGLDTAPLRALARVAEGLLERASTARPEDALVLVGQASELVPAGEAFHLACAEALHAAGATEAAVARLDLALEIAPGRWDLRTRRAEMRRERPPAPVAALPSPRESLEREHARARMARERAPLGGDEYMAACAEIARIEMEISRIAG